MLRTIICILGIWGLSGYFIMQVLPTPKNRILAISHIFLAGPIVWLMFPIISAAVIGAYFKGGSR